MAFSPQYLDSKPLPKPNRHDHRRTLSSISPSREVSGNSSLWAQDYFNDETIVGTETIGSVTPPPPVATTSRPFPRSIPLSENEEQAIARQPRTHQRSLTTLLPSFRIPKTRGGSRSPERSPQKEKTQEDLDGDFFMPTLTGDRDGVVRLDQTNKGGLSSWFTGSSAPVSVGISIGEQETDSPFTLSREESPERPSTKLRKRPTIQTSDSTHTTPSKTPPSSTSRFAFFSSPKSPPKQQIIQLPTDMLQSDEYLTLDIQTALFPPGSPIDPFSPSAFKNLLMNAEGTLLKLQTAYKLRTLSLHELSAEKEAQDEELEEAETRAAALKSQLEDMAARVTEQDLVMEELVNQLAAEKQARQEEKEAREKSIALIHENANRQLEKAETRASRCSNHGEEDLGITLAGTMEKKGWRRSGGSSEFESDTDMDSQDRESVFSRSMSPTSAGMNSSAASMVTNESTPEILQASFGRVVPVTVQSQRPKAERQPSTFQKMLSVTTGAPAKEEIRGIGLESGCLNCQGKEASVAWDAVGLLRAENKGLKDRVGDLEYAVDGALDLVAGLRL